MPTVLVVDDSAADRRLARGLLRKDESLEVVEAADGVEALEQIELHLPDVVLTDIQMPEMDGLELVGVIKREYALTPVVLMTAKGSEQSAVHALRLGAASYVPKRVLARDLLETIHRVLSILGEDRNRGRLLNRITARSRNFTLPNDPDLIGSLVRQVQDDLTSMHLCPESAALCVGIALQEALLNALYHGNLNLSLDPEQPETDELALDAGIDLAPRDRASMRRIADERSAQAPYCDRRIHFAAGYSRDRAVFRVADDGEGFDAAAALEAAEVGAGNVRRGLVLMKSFFDEVRYNESGNEVELVKNRVGPAGVETIETAESQ